MAAAPAKARAAGPSLKPYLAIVALLVVVGVASFSLVERWMAEPPPAPSADEEPIGGGGRVVIGRSATPPAAKPPAAATPSPEAPYKSQEFTFYKSLGNTTELTPKLEPPVKATPAPRAPSAKATKGAAPSARKYYTVQVGSFQDRRSADRLAAKVRRYQYTVSVNRVVLPDSGVRYRVRVGSFATRDDALKVAATLKKKERIEPFVALVAPASG
jgi:cell division septation protein DedD